MTALTPRGYPYPETTDRVADGWDAIRDLAVAVDSDLTAALAAVAANLAAVNTALDARLDVVEADTGWVAATLASGWSNYGSGYAAAAYRKWRGVTFLRGLVKRAGNAAADTILTLPAGYRPGGIGLYASVVAGMANVPTTDPPSEPFSTGVVNSIPNVAVRVDVSTSGAVTLNNGFAETGFGGGDVAFLSLAGIIFPAEA